MIFINGGFGKTNLIDNNKTEISCNNKTFSPANIGINLTSDEYFAYSLGAVPTVDNSNYQTYQNIIKNCYLGQVSEDKLTNKLTQSQFADNINALKEQDADQTVMDEYMNEYESDGMGGYITKPVEIDLENGQKLNFNGKPTTQDILDVANKIGIYKLFNIKPVYIYNYRNPIKILVAGNLLILLFFEVLKRVFYYVALGTLRPKK